MIDLSKRLHPGGTPVGVRVNLGDGNMATILFQRSEIPKPKCLTATLSFDYDDIVYNQVETKIILMEENHE